MENRTEYKREELEIVFGDVVLGVHGEDFHYLFSYQAGGMESLVVNGREWLYRAPWPTFWRASTDNDRGNGFAFSSAQWMGADLMTRAVGFRVWMDGEPVEGILAPENNRFGGSRRARQLQITYEYETATYPAARVQVSYCVQAGGRIHVKAAYHGRKGLPSLPVFGLRFLMPTLASGYTYTGRLGETYPDRKAGGRLGTYAVEGLPVTPYLVPQDCGVHMDTSQVTVTRRSTLSNTDRDHSPFSLTFSQDASPFAFSCLPYTALELENALHQEELPPARRTVLCILGAVRGVGGIDSWGADVEEAYRVSGEGELAFSFWIR